MAVQSKKTRLQRWLEDDFSWLARQRMRGMAFWHNQVPTIFKPLSLVQLAFRGGLIASAPATAVVYGSTSLQTAATVGGCLLLLNVGIGATDKLQKGRRRTELESHASIRFGDLLSTVRRNGVQAKDRDAAISACLGIIENFVVTAIGAKQGDISVTLIVYQGNKTSEMLVKQRNPGNTRPVNRMVSTKPLLGHHACQNDASPRVVNHINYFGPSFRSSPTQASRSYKSILILPLECHNASGAKIRGFVSIDAVKPYAFFGNRANVIVVMCDPVINQLKELV